MNRSAYFATGLVIKLLSRLTKASIVVHGQENIPTGPTIFVINHFTRLETLLLPAYIYNLTGKPAWSLAASSLFKGGLGKFLDMMGAVSTADPKRDEFIVKGLLTGEANWIIFPEGNMVKTKKIVAGGKFMIASHNGVHEPHTGAAALALRAELYRTCLIDSAEKAPHKLPKMLEALGLTSIEEVHRDKIAILPINLTYYPIRAAENIALDIASRLVKDIPEQMVEEIMTEGTMLLSGVDLDIRCGKAMLMQDYLNKEWLQEDMARDGISGFSVSPILKEKMRTTAYAVMQQYMQAIYAMTTINHEHLFASLLRMHPFNRIDEIDFRRRVFYGASLVRGTEDEQNPFYLHQSLEEDQAHLLTDDRFGKYANFLQLALEKGVVTLDGDYLVRDRSKLSAPISFHQGRMDNPIEIMANEVEPLKKLLSIIKSVSWQPKILFRYLLVRHLLQQEKYRYVRDCEQIGQTPDKEKPCYGRPFLLPGYRCSLGAVLVHSYLAVPAEVKELARYLRRRGIWVYAPRLPGHGTSVTDLADRKYREWVEAVENGYVLMSTICDRVVVGGIAVGGNLALDLAARVGKVAGVFALCPPYSLSDYSTNFMPERDVWKRIISKMKREDQAQQFFDFSHGNSHVNYQKNPVATIKEVAEYLESIEKTYSAISQPTLIIQANNNPVVEPKGTQYLYDRIGSNDKEFCLISDDRHILVNGAGTERVYRKIGDFIGALKGGRSVV